MQLLILDISLNVIALWFEKYRGFVFFFLEGENEPLHIIFLSLAGHSLEKSSLGNVLCLTAKKDVSGSQMRSRIGQPWEARPAAAATAVPGITLG